jgi:hypothetical protein
MTENNQERYKPTEKVMLDRNQFNDIETAIQAMKEKEKETAAQLFPKFSTLDGVCIVCYSPHLS